MVDKEWTSLSTILVRMQIFEAVVGLFILLPFMPHDLENEIGLFKLYIMYAESAGFYAHLEAEAYSVVRC